MPRILLVGTGITSAVTGALLKVVVPHAELIVWDRARGAGGRMATYWNSKNPESKLDLGAQYISITPDYANIHKMFYDDLKKEGLLAPLVTNVGGMKPSTVEGTKHYVAPKGISSIVKHFLEKIDSEIKYQHHVEKIDQDGMCWTVSTNNGIKDNFDVVVLTMPVPQILALSGEIRNIIEEDKVLCKHLREVEYSSRYALGLFYNNDDALSLNADNSAEYILSDPIMRFVSIDNLKRGEDNVSPSVVFHTSVPFGKAYLDKPLAEVQSSLLAKVKEMYPQWPEPVDVKCHKWKFSQVTSAYTGLPGAVEIGNGLIAGGDGFTQSNFDSCIESAKTISNMVLRYAP